MNDGSCKSKNKRRKDYVLCCRQRRAPVTPVLKFIRFKDNTNHVTVSIIVNTVLAFYDYALRHEEYSNNISERLRKI